MGAKLLVLCNNRARFNTGCHLQKVKGNVNFNQNKNISSRSVKLSKLSDPFLKDKKVLKTSAVNYKTELKQSILLACSSFSMHFQCQRRLLSFLRLQTPNQTWHHSWKLPSWKQTELWDSLPALTSGLSKDAARSKTTLM